MGRLFTDKDEKILGHLLSEAQSELDYYEKKFIDDCKSKEMTDEEIEEYRDEFSDPSLFELYAPRLAEQFFVYWRKADKCGPIFCSRDIEEGSSPKHAVNSMVRVMRPG